jgi:hypothetical protein
MQPKPAAAVTALPSHELMRRVAPNRVERARLGRQLGIASESLMYAFGAPAAPVGSGRPNPIDKMDAVLEHARHHHPDVAEQIVQRFAAGNAAALAERGRALRVMDTVVTLHPEITREAMDAVVAVGEALRQGMLTGGCDAESVLRELEECERAARRAAAVLRASITAERKEVA